MKRKPVEAWALEDEYKRALCIGCPIVIVMGLVFVLVVAEAIRSFLNSLPDASHEPHIKVEKEVPSPDGKYVAVLLEDMMLGPHGLGAYVALREKTDYLRFDENGDLDNTTTGRHLIFDAKNVVNFKVVWGSKRRLSITGGGCFGEKSPSKSVTKWHDVVVDFPDCPEEGESVAR